MEAAGLRRECTLALLRSYLRAPVRAFATISDLLQEAAAGFETPSCVLLCTGVQSIADEPWCGEVSRIRRALGSAAIIIMSDRAQLDDVVAAFRQGARGYILTSQEPRLAIEALRMVLAGSTYFPADVLMAHRTGLLPPAVRQEQAAAASDIGLAERLAPKQREVLRALAEGRTNKDISRRLLMEEATVKIHIRQIIRRLGVTNRTQAALLAHRCGIFLQPGAGSSEPSLEPVPTIHAEA
jgi:DNA-binding NarL/FixJ family response regulator